MSEVKRFKTVINDKPYKPYAYCTEDAEGNYVRYEDYAALKDSAMDYAYRWGKAQDDIKKAHMLHSMQKEEIASLKEQLTNAQEALKSAGIEADTVQAGVMELVDKLRIKQNHIQLRDTYIEELEQRAEAAEAVVSDVKEVIALLSEREWAEHCTKTETGMRLEELITELHDDAAEH